ncbi:hypothetical protein [Clostridium brassicae]|uniref:Uncharacterized protein n=1 Tax=Clostridium brassicae TaxID=2999072 RepID=A0ABT4D6L1_9CLOT|nr:hypothetical protein [Clostridium brassicae]MCY6957935.1 hypothetical protein [Clostridium brassicae]
MKLNEEQKFLLQDDDGNLILITEIDFNYELLKNQIMQMKGIKFEVDYSENTIEKHDEVEVHTSFSIDGIFKKED